MHKIDCAALEAYAKPAYRTREMLYLQRLFGRLYRRGKSKITGLT